MPELFREQAGIPLSQLQSYIDEFSGKKKDFINSLILIKSNRGQRLALYGIIRSNVMVNRLHNEQIHLNYLKGQMLKNVPTNQQ